VENDISMLPITENEPGYIKKFKEKLSRKRLVVETEVAHRLTPHLAHPWFNDYFESASTDIDASNPLRKVSHGEVSHYEHIFNNTLQNRNRFNCNKEPYMHALLFDLDSHVHQVDELLNPCLKL
jgi:hypothetical protein